MKFKEISINESLSFKSPYRAFLDSLVSKSNIWKISDHKDLKDYISNMHTPMGGLDSNKTIKDNSAKLLSQVNQINSLIEKVKTEARKMVEEINSGIYLKKK